MDHTEDAAIAADTGTEPDATDPIGDTSGGTTGVAAGSTEKRIRRLAGRSAAYRGEIVALTRGWVSRDGKMHAFAARYLDFAVLTPEHLVFCSTGFFTRRPRRRVFREPLSRLVVMPRGPEPVRALRIVGDFERPILLELRDKPDGLAFAEALLARTRAEGPTGPLSNHGHDDDAPGAEGTSPVEPPPAP